MSFGAALSADDEVEVLHFYSQRLANIVTANKGDIDMFAGARTFPDLQSDGTERVALETCGPFEVCYPGSQM